jgi:hypothetical protein
MKLSKLLALVMAVFLYASVAQAASNPPLHPVHNNFHPLVTNQGVLLGWWDNSTNKPATGTPPVGSYEVRDEQNRLRGWISVPETGAPYWTPAT